METGLSEVQSNSLFFVPNSLLDKYIRKIPVSKSLPRAQNSHALILITNILNFSHITQYYLKEHQNALKTVASIHKQFIKLVQDHISGTGADMLRYSTDRAIFYWAIPPIEADKCLDILSNVILYRLLRLKQILKDTFSQQGIQVNFSFVLTEGSFTTFSLRGPQNTIEYIHSGHSLFEVLNCPRIETNENLVLVSQNIVARIQSDFQIRTMGYGEERNKEQEDEETAKIPAQIFFAVLKPSDYCEAANLHIEGVDLRKLVKADQYEAINQEIISYIPKCMESYIKHGIEEWSNEIRKATVMFINIPLDPKDFYSEEELPKLQTILTMIHNSLQIYQGQIYRINFDSKGLNIFVLYGLYPNSHSDDGVRAILSALKITSDLSQIELPAYIGIATGEVLLSICGTFQKDLFILGEPLYTAFILSLVALRDGSKNVIVDFETKVFSESKLSFHQYNDPVFTGKIAEGIFEVIYTGQPLPSISLNLYPEIRCHYFNMDYSNQVSTEDKMSSLYMISRKTELESASQIFSQFLNNPTKPNALLIVGSYGIGKSLFTKNLLENITNTIDKAYSTEGKPTVLVSSITSTIQIKKLNGWRHIMKEILRRLAVSLGVKREKLVYSLFDQEEDLQESLYLMKDILDINLTRSGQQDDEQNEDSLVQRNETEAPQYEQRAIVKILVAILQRFLGEKVTFRNKETAKSSKDQMIKENLPPLILCFDDLQQHDELSWNLLIQVCKKIQKIFIIGVLRDDEISGANLRNVEDGLQALGRNQSLIMKKITLDPMRQEAIGAIVKRILGERELSDDLKRFFVSKSEGNPLLAINLIETLLKQRMLQEVTGVVFPTEKLSRLIKLDDYVEIGVPAMKLKLHSSFLDGLAFTHYNILKIASIIGEAFDLKTLVVTNPFHNGLVPFEVLVSSLQELRQNGILDLVESLSDNTTYRFSSPFLRETLYQRIAYNLRKRQHRMIAISYSDQVSESGRDEQKTQYHWQLSKQEQEGQKMGNDSTRRNYLIDRINKIVSHPTKRGDLVVKVGEINKQSMKNGQKWILRYSALSQNTLKYYKSEQDFLERPILEAGSIPLKEIIAVTPTNGEAIQQAYSDVDQAIGFKVLTEKWQKGSQWQSRREFWFSCQSLEEEEDWSLCLEYMRNKAVYQDFLTRFDVVGLGSKKSGELRGSTSSPKKIRPDDRGSPDIKGWLQNSNQEDPSFNETTDFERSPMLKKGPFQDLKSRDASPFAVGRNNSYEKIDINKKQKNKELVKALLNKGQITFWSYLFNAPFKTSLRGKGFGKNSDIIKEKPDLMRIDADLLQKREANIMNTKDVLPSKISFGADKIITEKLTSYDVGKVGFSPTLSSKYDLLAAAQRQTSNYQNPNASKSWVRLSEVDESVESIRNTQKYGGETRETEYVNLLKKDDYQSPEKEKKSRPIQKLEREDNAHETVEKVIKANKGGKIGSRIYTDNTVISSRSEDKTGSTRVTFKPQPQRDLSKPNIYGRYDYFPTFFSDSYADDKIFISKSNKLYMSPKRTHKVSKMNIPHADTMVIIKSQEGGKDVYVMKEESHRQMKNAKAMNTVQSSVLEDEVPIYRSSNKKVQDFTAERFRIPDHQYNVSSNIDRFFQKNLHKQSNWSPETIQDTSDVLSQASIENFTKNMYTPSRDFSDINTSKPTANPIDAYLNTNKYSATATEYGRSPTLERDLTKDYNFKMTSPEKDVQRPLLGVPSSYQNTVSPSITKQQNYLKDYTPSVSQIQPSSYLNSDSSIKQPQYEQADTFFRNTEVESIKKNPLNVSSIDRIQPTHFRGYSKLITAYKVLYSY